MHRHFLFSTLVLALACAFARGGERWVFPPEAINDAMHLKEDEFRILNPGIDISISGLSDEGFYVRYIHEDLIYYFGPISDLETARRWRDDMVLVRERLVQKRPTLEESKVELVRFTHERAGGSGAGTGSGSEPTDVDGDGRIDSEDDINGDGVIDERDVEVFRAAGRNIDVNGDGVVDSGDDINGDGCVDGDDVRV